MLTEWVVLILSNDILKKININIEINYNSALFYLESYKRNIKKIHYQYQADKSVSSLWRRIIELTSDFICRCIDARSRGVFLDDFKEFYQPINKIIDTLTVISKNIYETGDPDLYDLKDNFKSLLRLCAIEITDDVPNKPTHVKVTLNPKLLFKGEIFDTENCIVGFIDILGFSEIINEFEQNELSNSIKHLHLALHESVDKTITELQDKIYDYKEHLEYHLFSDCLCLSMPYFEDDNDFVHKLFAVITTIKLYQFVMMQNGFFTRGAVAIGTYYSDDHMIFSGGLVKAYHLEQTAIFPRVLISNEILEKLKENKSNLKKLLNIDKSFIQMKSEVNKVFINPFDLSDFFIDLKNLKYENKPIIEIINEYIRTNIKKYQNEKNICNKYEWLLNLINWVMNNYENNSNFNFYIF